MNFVPSPGIRHANYVAVEAVGASGYFSKPSVELDPHLFVGDQLRPNVRNSVLRLLYGHLGTLYDEPEAWSTVWIAGSGVSYQWGADRGGVGDLDVLIGVNVRRFLQSNADFRGLPETQIADRINQEMHDRLWPTTATYDFGGQKYEVTFYVNSTAEDIRDISPYAAFNITANEWTVRPIELPADWGLQSLPPAWRQKFDADTALGHGLIARYNGQVAQAEATTPGSPQWVNAHAALRNTVEQAGAMFEEIHAGRHGSFTRGGAGYRGFENARWQMAKSTGVIDGLRKIRAQHSQNLQEANEVTYGRSQLEGAEQAGIRAALWSTKYRS